MNTDTRLSFRLRGGQRQTNQYWSTAGGSSPVLKLAGIRSVVPFQLATESGILFFFSTTTIFGTPVDITLSELAIESFFPADTAIAQTLRLLTVGQG